SYHYLFINKQLVITVFLLSHNSLQILLVQYFKFNSRVFADSYLIYSTDITSGIYIRYREIQSNTIQKNLKYNLRNSDNLIELMSKTIDE
ncbi:hypothetical protein BpHYR1_047160, partial [Brachionus plicatilis]